MEELKEILSKVLKYNYANFNGRASRREYWLFVFMSYLYMMICTFAAYIIAIILFFIALTANSFGSLLLLLMIYGLMFLAFLPVLLPLLALGARRLHDTGRSGWWLLLGFIPLIGGIILAFFLVQQGDKGQNQYGEDPRIREYEEYLNSLPNF